MNGRVRGMVSVALIAVLLGALVAANLITTEFGPDASIYNAFFLIGLTLTVRDVLHDLWREHRVAKMGALIAAGSLLAYALNRDAAQVALASCVAFAVAESADFAMYAMLDRFGWDWLRRVSGSNFVSSALDSLVFPTIAFGGVMWGITLGQFTAKVAGGLLFALLLVRVRPREAAA